MEPEKKGGNEGRSDNILSVWGQKWMRQGYSQGIGSDKKKILRCQLNYSRPGRKKEKKKGG